MPNYKLLLLKDLICFWKILFPLSQRTVCDNGKKIKSELEPRGLLQVQKNRFIRR
jgi:hypothetical protein